jgi:hypothetical protein
LSPTLERVLAETEIDIRSPDLIMGQFSHSRREVDVAIRGRIGATDVLIVVECRDRAQTEDVTWIEQLAQKLEKGSSISRR